PLAPVRRRRLRGLASRLPRPGLRGGPDLPELSVAEDRGGPERRALPDRTTAWRELSEPCRNLRPLCFRRVGELLPAADALPGRLRRPPHRLPPPAAHARPGGRTLRHPLNARRPLSPRPADALLGPGARLPDRRRAGGRLPGAGPAEAVASGQRP